MASSCRGRQALLAIPAPRRQPHFGSRVYIFAHEPRQSITRVDKWSEFLSTSNGMRSSHFLGCRFASTYAGDPQKWQSDTDVREYGRLLAVEAEDPASFVAAAAKLRSRLDLPADLRASAGRAQARSLGMQAVRLYEGLRIHAERSWPSEAYEEAAQAASRAADLYKAVVAESKDEALLSELEGVCADWQEATAASEAAYMQIRKLRAQLCGLRVRWLLAQVELARAVMHANHNGNPADAQRSTDRLRSVGLPEAQEDELLQEVVGLSESIVELCTADESGADPSDLKALRQNGQILQIVHLKDLALACACKHKIEEAAQHMIQALSIRLDAGKPLPNDIKEQVGTVAQAVWEHCTKNMKAATTTAKAEEVLRLSTTLGSSLMSFNAQRSG